MPYLIDSDHVIDHLEALPAVVALLDQLADQGLAISTVTYMEAYQGILRSPDVADAQARFERFLAGVQLLPFSRDVAETCARLRQQLRAENKRVNSRALDIINAATAIHYGLVLVTRNLGDYQDIPNLQLYQPGA